MSNLLQKASIVTTPTAYGVGVLNSIKPAQSFSEELITNGNFASGYTGWSTYGVTSVSDGIATIGASANSGIFQTILTQSRKYKITLNVTSYNGVGTVEVCDDNGDIKYSVTSIGVQSFTFTQTHSTGGIVFRGRSNAIFSLSNVSVVEVTDADFDFTRNSSATRVNPDYLIQDVSILSSNLVQNGNFSELGSEKIINGDFSSNANWTLTQATISEGSLNFSTTNGSFAGARQFNVFTVGKTYLISLEISNIVGTIEVDVNSGSNYGQTFTTNGLKSFYLKAENTDIEIKRAFNAEQVISATIDNVSVKQVDPNDNWTLNGVNIALDVNGIKLTTNTSGGGIYQGLSTNVGSNYILKLDFLTGDSNGIVQVGTSVFGGELYQNTSVTNDLTINFTATSTTTYINLRVSGNGFCYYDNISLIEIQQTDIPRLDYTNGTASILLENQSTNLFPYSQDFSNSAWTKTGSATVTTNTTISPDGTQNADTLSLLIGSYFYESISSGAGTFTISCYVKVTSGTLDFKMQSFTPSVGANASSVFTANTEWQRFEFTTTVTADSNFYPVFIDSPLTGGVFEIWGAQLEQQSYATSYIPTSGSTVTRAAETLNNAGNSDLINSTEGVLYIEAKSTYDSSNSRRISISDGTISNRVSFEFDETTENTIKGFVSSGGVTQATLTHSAIDLSEYNKMAIKYKANDFSLFINGQEVDVDATGSAPIGLDSLQLQGGANTNFMYGNVKCVAVFKEALSDTELACLTSTNNREIFLNYYYRMQYVGANTEALSCAEQTFNI